MVKRAALVLSLCIVAAGATRAQEAGPPQDLRERRWYGWQIMLADAASVGLIYAGAQGDNGTLVALGVAGALTLPPLIHLAHRAPGDALASLAVRAVPFGLSLAIFAAIHPDCGEGCGELFIPFFGIVLSGVGAIVDWTFFSTETVAPRLSLRPTLPMGDPASRGLALALRF